MTIAGLEAVLASGKLSPADQGDFIQALGNLYYNTKDYPKAIATFNKYAELTGDSAKLRPYIVRSYYFNNDFATAKTELLKDLDTNTKAGKVPPIEELQLLANTGAKSKDTATYLIAIEKLVQYYPSDDYWIDLLSRTQGKSTYSTRFALDVYRLEKTVVSKMAPEDYTEMAELALLAGQPIEAKKTMDAGYAAGVLGTGPSADKHKKIKAQADKQAADDTKNIATGEASAKKSKDGTGLVNLGYAYVTLEQFDKGIELIKEGIAKGGLKNAEDAKLRLGYSYAMAGKKDEAIKVLDTVQGADGRADLARFWTLWLNRPAPGAAAAAK
jgi:tetratricopeptide (TPR) repeat protein